jgi:hypothetical protein
MRGEGIDGRPALVCYNFQSSARSTSETTFVLTLDWTTFPGLVHAPSGLTADSLVIPSGALFQAVSGAPNINTSTAGVTLTTPPQIINRRLAWNVRSSSGSGVQAGTTGNLGLDLTQSAGLAVAARTHRLIGAIGAADTEATYTEVEVTGQIEQLRVWNGSSSAVARPLPLNSPGRIDTRTVGILVRPIGAAGCLFVAVDGEWHRGADPTAATTCTLGVPVALGARIFEIQMASPAATLRHRPFAAAPAGAEGQMYTPPIPARTWAGF